ncbi:MAG: proton-conducting transporter membrane subunit [Vulcanimicrobiota bacterium]
MDLDLIYLDWFEGCVLTLVAFLGWLVAGYARTYLRGEPCQAAFWKWFAVTLLGVSSFVVSGQWLQLGLSWMLTSLGVHRLLLLHPGRREALVAAHKKFLISRSADLCFAAAAFVWWRAGGGPTLNGTVALPQAQLVAWLLTLAVILKSALYPFHGWLVQVAEAPTPVSALLHAGVLNLGAVLLYKANPLLGAAPEAQLGLAGWGCLSAFYGSLASLRQSDIKGSLAASTVAQMGFVLMECACGAFHLALVHILAHSLYKARGFLRSGSIVEQLAQERLWQPRFRPHLSVWLVASLLLTPWAGFSAPALGWIWCHTRVWWLGPVLAGISFSCGQVRLADWTAASPLWAVLGLWALLQLTVHTTLVYQPGGVLSDRLDRLFLWLDSADEWLTRLALRVWPVELPVRTRFFRLAKARSEVAHS